MASLPTMAHSLLRALQPVITATDWHFFEPGSDKHFVILGRKVEPWSLS
jgi:hypothetical protein